MFLRFGNDRQEIVATQNDPRCHQEATRLSSVTLSPPNHLNGPPKLAKNMHMCVFAVGLGEASKPDETNGRSTIRAKHTQRTNIKQRFRIEPNKYRKEPSANSLQKH